MINDSTTRDLKNFWIRLFLVSSAKDSRVPEDEHDANKIINNIDML